MTQRPGASTTGLAPAASDVVQSGRILLPPSARSRAALGLTAAAAVGRFELQVCLDCAAVQYPPREACHRCLSSQLDWRLQDGRGELLSETTLLHSHHDFFRSRLPIRLGLVRLDAGPTAVVYLHDHVSAAPCRVRLEAHLDKAGLGALVAFAEGDVTRLGDSEMTNSKLLREMTCDPKGRKVLVTDASGAAGVALVQSLVDAGAETVWAGHGTHAETPDQPGLRDLAANFKQVRLVALDITSDQSVRDVAALVGPAVDILINSAEARGSAPQTPTVAARVEMDVNYFGLLRLAQAFGPLLRERAGAAHPTVTAWVNLLSIYALSGVPTQSTFSASKAAAYSLSQSLRAEMLAAGIRVVNVFPGPIGDESSRVLAPPKLAPAALARAIVMALRDGLEDVYPGEVAQDWFARWRDNPKVLERELAVGC
jgi:NAD(P)-dependent dehydrogenase (short-subunit alcohol dehydrogenase family)/uncharacterized OB-fold protein